MLWILQSWFSHFLCNLSLFLNCIIRKLPLLGVSLPLTLLLSINMQGQLLATQGWVQFVVPLRWRQVLIYSWWSCICICLCLSSKNMQQHHRMLQMRLRKCGAQGLSSYLFDTNEKFLMFSNIVNCSSIWQISFLILLESHNPSQGFLSTELWLLVPV